MMHLPHTNPKGLAQKLESWLDKRAQAIWANLLTNHLWQRILKNTLATTIAVILALIPAIVAVYGRAVYLAPITTVFGHPGRRFGMMAEALVLAVGGTMLGMGWSIFGIYLSSLIYRTNTAAAYTIRGLFLMVALLFHGFVRSHSPRLFIFVLLFIIVNVVTLTSTATAVSTTLVTIILYPILTAVGVLLLVNTVVFPEFSSSFLGITTIETLGETVHALRDAGKYFVTLSRELDKPSENEESDETGNMLEKAATAAEPPARNANNRSKTSGFQRLMRGFKRAEKKDEPEAKPDAAPNTVKLKTLTDSKAKLRTKLASCKAAQTECNFELAWAVLPPRDLKPISDTSMKKLVANTIALIGACESKYALMGDENDKTDIQTENVENIDESSRPTTADSSQQDSSDEGQDVKKKQKKQRKSKSRLSRDMRNLELVKPKKEIESGDIELLRHLVFRITKPLADLQEKIDRSVDVVTCCLAYCYDVPKVPSGALAPSGIKLEEIDIWVDTLDAAISTFDKDSAAALENAAAIHNLDYPQVDVMPRMETFLISSFLLNLRQAALQTLHMLNHSRIIVEKRQTRHGRHRIYFPQINWRKWLTSGGEEDALALPSNARKDARTGRTKQEPEDEDESVKSKETLESKTDVESAPARNEASRSPEPVREDNKTSTAKIGSVVHRVRNGLADIIEYLAGSEDLLYAVKLTIAVFLVTWPAFLHDWNAWYYANRGMWAALQLILITEVAVGASVWVFILRAVGTTLGCIWGWAAYEAHNGNRIVCVVILFIGVIPSAYIQLGSKYIKAGMISIVSMCIVALATENVPGGTATDNFLKRLIAFLIGGIVALMVQLVFFPVKARDRLVESLAASINQISEMEACLAYGIETEANLNVQSAKVSARFDRAKGKAQGALAAAETFLPFCANEPRLKGSFKGLALVYAEILYVLHAVVDRMDNMLHLRYEYGSGVLEELNEKVFPYRRNVAGSITLILFACHEALTTKLPLPQFLPSARLAHLRMVNRVREVVLAGHLDHHRVERSEIEISMVKRVVRQKFLSWNAASAGQIEVIEYLEELCELIKLLVGANEFRSGMLTRPTYRDWVDRIDRGARESDSKNVAPVGRDGAEDTEEAEGRDMMPEPGLGLRHRRTTFRRNEEYEEMERQRVQVEEELPRSLQRVRSRRIEEITLQRTRTREEEIMREGLMKGKEI